MAMCAKFTGIYDPKIVIPDSKIHGAPIVGEI